MNALASDLLNEDGKLFRLTKAADFIPTHPAASTLWRWATKGVCGVRLETVRVGGFAYTNERAIHEFLKATNMDFEFATMTRDELLEKLSRMVNGAQRRAKNNKRYDSQQRAIGAAKALATVRELVAMLPR